MTKVSLSGYFATNISTLRASVTYINPTEFFIAALCDTRLLTVSLYFTPENNQLVTQR